MKYLKKQIDESSRTHKHTNLNFKNRAAKAPTRLFKSSHNILTLKENAIKNLRKELTQQKQYQFKHKALSKIFSEKMSEVYQMIFLL